MKSLFNQLWISILPPTNPNKIITPLGSSLIKRYEGLGPRGVVLVNNEKVVFPYVCPSGKPTIGRGRVIPWDLYYKLKDTGISLKQAEDNFKEDVDRFSREVAKLVKVYTTEWQFDSTVSLAYNIGLANLKGSTLLRKLNAKDYVGAANEFSRWVYGNHKKLPGLVNRREAEKRMFLNNPPRPVIVKDNVQSILDKKDYMKMLVAE